MDILSEIMAIIKQLLIGLKGIATRFLTSIKPFGYVFERVEKQDTMVVRATSIYINTLLFILIYTPMVVVTLILYLIFSLAPIGRFGISLYYIIKKYSTTTEMALLTTTKHQMYFIYVENLWHIINDYQEDLGLRIKGSAYRLTVSNPFILRNNVWLYRYRVRKKNSTAFTNEQIENIAETVYEEITNMLNTGHFEGVIYPNNYNFVVDSVVDCGSYILLYILFVESQNDVDYISSRNMANFDIKDTAGVMEDEDFGN